jgi:hypothetical protein
VRRVVGSFKLIITVSVLSIVPLIAAFLFPQRYWQSSLTLGRTSLACQSIAHTLQATDQHKTRRFQRVSEWARLGSNQRPPACEEL